MLCLEQYFIKVKLTSRIMNFVLFLNITLFTLFIDSSSIKPHRGIFRHKKVKQMLSINNFGNH